VGGPSLVFHSVEVLFCPASFEQSLGLRIERSPPTHLRVRSRLGRETSRGRAPRCSPETAPAIPHRGTPARDPHAPAPWLLSPAGRISPPSPPSSRTLERSWHRMLGFYVFSRRVGGSIARRVGGHLSGGCRDPARGSGLGCR
jgi:hypothetical protein